MPSRFACRVIANFSIANCGGSLCFTTYHVSVHSKITFHLPANVPVYTHQDASSTFVVCFLFFFYPNDHIIIAYITIIILKTHHNHLLYLNTSPSQDLLPFISCSIGTLLEITSIDAVVKIRRLLSRAGTTYLLCVVFTRASFIRSFVRFTYCSFSTFTNRS